MTSKGIVFQTGEKWKMVRNLLSPSFNFDALKQRVQLMKTVTQEVIDNVLANHDLKQPETVSIIN